MLKSKTLLLVLAIGVAALLFLRSRKSAPGASQSFAVHAPGFGAQEVIESGGAAINAARNAVTTAGTLTPESKATIQRFLDAPQPKRRKCQRVGLRQRCRWDD